MPRTKCPASMDHFRISFLLGRPLRYTSLTILPTIRIMNVSGGRGGKSERDTHPGALSMLFNGPFITTEALRLTTTTRQQHKRRDSKNKHFSGEGFTPSIVTRPGKVLDFSHQCRSEDSTPCCYYGTRYTRRSDNRPRGPSLLSPVVQTSLPRSRCCLRKNTHHLTNPRKKQNKNSQKHQNTP